jgi:hypothetical protein
VRERALVLLPDRARVPLPAPELPELVQSVIAGIVAHDSAGAQEAVAVWEEERAVSKCARPFRASLRLLRAAAPPPPPPLRGRRSDRSLARRPLPRPGDSCSPLPHTHSI